jgi:hypothetical protein
MLAPRPWSSALLATQRREGNVAARKATHKRMKGDVLLWLSIWRPRCKL